MAGANVRFKGACGRRAAARRAQRGGLRRASRPGARRPRTIERRRGHLVTGMTGNEIVARCLTQHGVDTVFFLMGGPMIDCENACEQAGLKMIDVRHEQAAAMMAHAYARIRRRPGVCMAASGPGVTNLVTGVADAYVDSAPIVALGGS